MAEKADLVKPETASGHSSVVTSKDNLLDAYYALLSAVMFAKQFLNNLESDAASDDPLRAVRQRFHAPLHARLDAALALASKLVTSDTGDSVRTNNSSASLPESGAESPPSEAAMTAAREIELAYLEAIDAGHGKGAEFPRLCVPMVSSIAAIISRHLPSEEEVQPTVSDLETARSIMEQFVDDEYLATQLGLEGAIASALAAARTSTNSDEVTRALADPVSPRVGCVDGEPMMHGPKSYRWCATHDDLMLRCEFLCDPVSPVEKNYCPTCKMFCVLPNHCDNCGGELIFRPVSPVGVEALARKCAEKYFNRGVDPALTRDVDELAEVITSVLVGSQQKDQGREGKEHATGSGLNSPSREAADDHVL